MATSAKCEGIMTLPGLLVIFECAHKFIWETDDPPQLTDMLDFQINCPFCVTHECLSCGGAFSGWLDICRLCEKFSAFDEAADDALARGEDKLGFKHGILMLPDQRPFRTGPRILDWMRWPSLGIGYIQTFVAELEDGTVGVKPGAILYLSELRSAEDEEVIRVTRRKDLMRIDIHVRDYGSSDEQREISLIP
ncbi:hypothetical protein F5Y15DRAFT_414672 [Xylariaceae sp. FL0016]|nr:hypothetical protein F5Y15DRAFT_414672 [Xylariaceae sp. FL0016]